MRVIVCPGCSVKIKVPADRSGRCACPKCGKGLLIKPAAAAPPATAPPPAPPQPLPTDLFPTEPAAFDPLGVAGDVAGETPSSGFAGAGLPNTGFPAAGVGGRGPAAKRPAAGKAEAPLKPFLKRLGIGLGILSAALLLLTAAGLIAEPIAMVASGVGVFSAVLLLVGGKIWLWVIAFQESVVQGLLVLFVPYYWIAYLATRKGRTLRPLAVLISSVVPLLLTLLMLAVFAGRYEGAARSFRGSSRAPRLRIAQSKIRDAEARIRTSYETSGEAEVLRTVSFQSIPISYQRTNPAKAEQVLGDLPGYVPGSFRIDEPARVIMFQYHGEEKIGSMYAYCLVASADVKMHLTPKFVAESDLPAANVLRSNTPATSPRVATTPVPSIAPAASAAAAIDELQTVSFSTLGQTQIDSARAESVLAESSGFVPGSFRFDQAAQTVTFQYRGLQASAIQYAFGLQRLGITLRLKPTFAEAAP